MSEPSDVSKERFVANPGGLTAPIDVGTHPERTRLGPIWGKTFEVLPASAWEPLPEARQTGKES